MEKVEYSYEPHSWTKRKHIPQGFCAKCGLIPLRNNFTQWAIDKGCEYRYHPSYVNVRKKHSVLD